MSDTPFSVFIGIDWATCSHEVCLLVAGQKRTHAELEHSEAAIAGFVAGLARRFDPQAVAVAIERPDHPLADALLLHGIAVFTINPMQLDRFRDRHTVAGAKDDRLDAFVLADALRTDLHLFRKLVAPGPVTLALRGALRRHATLSEDFRRFTNRLGQVLREWAPDLLTLCPEGDQPFFWELLAAGADPAHASRLRLSRVASILARYHVRRLSPEDTLARLRTPRLQLLPGGAEALTETIHSLLPQLAATQRQLQLASQRLATLIAEAGPDAVIISSFKGAGPVVTAALLAEATDAIACRDLAALRARCGTAPVTHQSGKVRTVSMRHACNPLLRNACFAFARNAIIYDPWAKALFADMRARGHRYARCLRGIADRLLDRLVSCLRHGHLYSPQLKEQTAATS